MANNYFRFKKFLIEQENCAMKVCTDSCILGAYAANKIESNDHPPSSVLDIGGGTGLLSLMIAQKCECTIDAIEMDLLAFHQMEENFKRSPWAQNLNPIHADIRDWPSQKKYDVIIANPPFFEKDLKGSSSTKVLAMHDSGLLLSDLVFIIQRKLRHDGGLFCLMVLFFRQEYLINLLDSSGMDVTEILNVRQTPSHVPFRSIITGNLLQSKTPAQTTVMTIKENNSYSASFKVLLHDYYLKHV